MSGKHANFIINTGDATASDIEALINLVRIGWRRRAEFACSRRCIWWVRGNRGNDRKRIRIWQVAVLMGGQSAERAVSLDGGRAVLESLLRSSGGCSRHRCGRRWVTQLQSWQI